METENEVVETEQQKMDMGEVAYDEVMGATSFAELDTLRS
jgi:hypothetical protein